MYIQLAITKDIENTTIELNCDETKSLVIAIYKPPSFKT